MTGPANRRRRQPEDAHHAGKSRSVRKQQTNPARTTWIRFDKVRTFPESFLTPRRNLQNEGRTEVPVPNSSNRAPGFAAASTRSSEPVSGSEGIENPSL